MSQCEECSMFEPSHRTGCSRSSVESDCYTPAPWHVAVWAKHVPVTTSVGKPSSIYAETEDGEFNICNFDVMPDDPAAIELNARIIAQAPRMFEFLQRFVAGRSTDSDGNHVYWVGESELAEAEEILQNI